MRDDFVGVPTVTPSNVDLERQILAHVLVDAAAVEPVLDMKTEDFFDDVNGQIFETIVFLHTEGRPINAITVGDAMHAFRTVEGHNVVVYLSFGATDAFDIASAVMVIRELSMRRRIMRTADAMTDMATNYKAKIPAIIAETVRSIDELTALSAPAVRTLWTLGEAIEDVINRMQDGETPDLIKTGISAIDGMGCVRRGQYALIAGRSSMGKSALAVCYSLGAARQGHGVVFFSMEMPYTQVTARSITEASYGKTTTHIAYSDALNGNVPLPMIEQIARASNDSRGLPIWIDEQGALTVADIALRTRRYKKDMAKVGISLDMVVVDHMSKISASGRYKGNKVNEVTEMSHALFQLGRTEKIAVIALSQLNRGVEGRDNKRPTLSDLRDSGSLEQDADIVMFAYRESYYLERIKYDNGSNEEIERLAQLERLNHVLEIGFAKNRTGRTGSCEVFVDMASNYIGDLDRSTAYGRQF